MLRLITGKAGTGKTGKIACEIAAAVNEKRFGTYLLVPELFSYEAQRELCRVCGDSLSLYSHVTTFTELSRQVLSELGGEANPYMDDGGRLLCMSLALRELQKSGALRYFSSSAHRSDTAAMMLSALDEMKQCAISPSDLLALSSEFDDRLAGKLSDLSSAAVKYDEIVSEGHADPGDRLSLLYRQIEYSSFGPSDTFYVDGFIGFTENEFLVLRALMRKGVNMVVCLTMDRIDGTDVHFEVPRCTARRLKRMAAELSVEYLEERYIHSGGEAEKEAFTCGSLLEECEFAAVRTLELIRDYGCRYRDIAVAVRGFEDYRSMLESTFEKFSIPLYTARKEALSAKPLPVFISSAYEICRNGFQCDDVLTLIGTGLTGIDQSSADEFCEYIFRWNIREGHWRMKHDWNMHPDGYGEKFTRDTYDRLSRINSARNRLGKALIGFADSCAAASTVKEHVAALGSLLEDLSVNSQMKAADVQVWEMCIGALEQMNLVLGDKATDTDEFFRLYLLMLSKYDVGSIPDSVDSVSAGDFDRMRRRHIRFLIVLGASDDRIPAVKKEEGLFSSDELDLLSENDLHFGGSGEERLFREFSLIYNCLSLPSDKLIFCYSGKPAYITDKAALTAVRYVPVYSPKVVPPPRGSLSVDSIKALYGDDLHISASKADRFYSCRYSYFCQYGLNARPYKEARFSTSEFGTFVHYILEHIAKDVSAKGGFKKVSDEELIAMTKSYIDDYIRDEFHSFEDMSDRFVYLFRRIENDTYSIVLDTAAELRTSEFSPAAEELDLSDGGPVSLGDGSDSLLMSGIADRVDEWESGGKRFIRVVDYKTGLKSFSLSDIWYGKSMQMLLYLYALSEGESGRTVPAGVMYVPANNRIISLSQVPDEETVRKKKAENRRRTGLVLDSFGVPEAWESGENKQYEPKDSPMSLEQFSLLTQHMTEKLSRMAYDIRQGSIDADPCRSGSRFDACSSCDYRGSCGFRDGENNESVRNLKKLPKEKVWELMEQEVTVNE